MHPDNDIELKCPERALWLAVIQAAISDACATYCLVGKTHTKYVLSTDRSAALNREAARRWLTGRSRDFREVCSLAGLNWEAVHDVAVKLQAAGWPPGVRMRLDRGP
ncbi:hypothetical protein PQJ75_00880 [Rhodoplanes sp. TEM]|uniref:Uncharacterized protein n=1 Tax=Rhodoplanes tepidamans TaxID=200616 RepID=A0ABT5J5U5_RHOTP|nr:MULTISPECIES: hypothetical protein [Rhodoplanes]MDC7784807.1 hypothetical protein [Rhodoplanes tepidamans]MDC7982274.1 hypothetical protein [Rhodoplanes sp. TEM]MDQ0356281.1 hypothetical protein [Rhodoplanes tepidamans]